ncbi:uncharacterized protein LOC144567732 [Carex rostrata]
MPRVSSYLVPLTFFSTAMLLLSIFAIQVSSLNLPQLVPLFDSVLCRRPCLSVISYIAAPVAVALFLPHRSSSPSVRYKRRNKHAFNYKLPMTSNICIWIDVPDFEALIFYNSIEMSDFSWCSNLPYPSTTSYKLEEASVK